MEQGSKQRSVKIGDDERLGWSSERPRREGGPPRPADISTRNRVLKPSEELMYSPGSLVVVASPAPAEAEAFVNRLVQNKGALFSMNKVRTLLHGPGRGGRARGSRCRAARGRRREAARVG